MDPVASASAFVAFANRTDSSCITFRGGDDVDFAAVI